MNLEQYWTVGEIAREVSDRTGVAIRPRDITDLFYSLQIPGVRCPIIGGRRLIPRDVIPVIMAALSRRGRIPVSGGGES